MRAVEAPPAPPAPPLRRSRSDGRKGGPAALSPSAERPSGTASERSRLISRAGRERGAAGRKGAARAASTPSARYQRTLAARAPRAPTLLPCACAWPLRLAAPSRASSPARRPAEPPLRLASRVERWARAAERSEQQRRPLREGIVPRRWERGLRSQPRAARLERQPHLMRCCWPLSASTRDVAAWPPRCRCVVCLRHRAAFRVLLRRRWMLMSDGVP